MQLGSYTIITINQTSFKTKSFYWIAKCYFCLGFVMLSCASVYWCLVVTCWERADLVALVCDVNCEVVTFSLVSWVRCGA